MRNAPEESVVTAAARPAMSVVVVTDRYETIRRTIRHLLSQTIRHQLEIVIVTSATVALQADRGELAPFFSHQVVELGAIPSIGRANAAGVRRANASIVALAEDHCFPDSTWAEQMLAAHRAGWAAVGPGVRNANPNTAVSWADLLIGYGPWLSPSPSREMEFLPGHNSSYKREFLLEYRERLDPMMEAETVLHWDLRRKGHRLYMEAHAMVAHTNFSLWSSWIPAQFYNGRLFAGRRGSEQSLAWRVAFTLGAPLIPAVRLWRIWVGLPTKALRWKCVQCLPALTIGLAIDGLGQMIGYARGVGDALHKVAPYEADRFHHVRAEDRAAIWGG